MFLPYFVIILAYDLLSESHQVEYYARVEFFHKPGVISDKKKNAKNFNNEKL